MNYRQFLFEAAIDLWLKKNTELSQEEKLEAQIIFKDLQTKYVEHLDPRAKNLVPLSFQTLKLLYLAIQKARDENLFPTTTQWLTKQIIDGKVFSLQNIEEDYIPPLKVYQNNKENLPKLNTVSDIKDLNDILNESLEPEQKELVPESDLGKIAEMGGWVMYMPHTTAASCELGKTGGKRDTTWCTTRTEGRNLYLHYVGRSGDRYILFYVIKRGVNAKKQPFAKMSVGTAGDKILFDQGDNNVTVNSNNENLTEEKFREVLGDETADFFLDKIREVIGQTETEHPLRLEMERLARDPKLFLKRLEQYGNSEEDEDARHDLKKEVLSYEKTVHPEILAMLANDDSWEIQGIVAENPNTPQETLAMFAEGEDEYVRSAVSRNPNISGKVLEILAKKDMSNYVRLNIASNPNVTPKTLEMLAEETPHGDVAREIARNPNTPPEVLEKLAKDKRSDVRFVVVLNPNTPLEVLEKLAKDENGRVRYGLIDNPNITPEILAILANDKEDYIRSTLAENKKTPPEILAILAKDKSDSVRYSLTKNPNTPPEIVAILAKDKSDSVRYSLTKNPNTPPEIVKKIRAELGLRESRKPKKISLLSIIFRN